MIISHDRYLNKLIAHKHNHLIKIVTGIRRCGKSFLLFNIFKTHLMSEGVPRSHIIEIELDNRLYKELRDPDQCLQHVMSLITDSSPYYLLIDEVQYMSEFEDVLNSFLHIDNLDVYVMGSNSKFLSSDIITEFRGRGDEIRVRPLSFAEYCAIFPDKPWDEAWNIYHTYGGLPYTVLLENEGEKANYLRRLFDEVYLKDIVERNHVANGLQLERLIDIVASSIGSLTNPQKLADTFKSNGYQLSAVTIKQYLDYIADSFLVEKAKRYDIKGKRYISTPQKYPVETKIDSAFSPHDTQEYAENTIDMYKTYKELKECENDVKSAKSSLNIYSDSYARTYMQNEYRDHKAEYEAALAKKNRTKKRLDNIIESLRKMEEQKPEFIGYSAIHRYRANTNGGQTAFGTILFLFDKEMKNIVFSYDLDSYESEEMQETLEEMKNEGMFEQ